MSTPLVSIVIDNFNYARFLPRSIESALAQSHPRTEVVVVDDASRDGSAEVIRSYGERVVAVLQERNGGQGAALTAGFAAARGDLVLFLDADDWLYPEAAARVAAAWRPGTAIVQYRLHLVDVAGAVIDTYPRPELALDSGVVAPRLFAIGRFDGTVTSGNAFSREALRAIMPIPADEFRISADGYLITVAPLYGPVVSIEEPLGAYRQHGGNAWSASGTAAVRNADGLRRGLDHDEARYRALARHATALGLPFRPGPGLRDENHLGVRLASLCIDPARHPYPSDSRLGLGLRGAWSCRTVRVPWKRRAVLAAWFLAAGALPRALAGKVIDWRFFRQQRSRLVDRVLKVLRRATR